MLKKNKASHNLEPEFGLQIHSELNEPVIAFQAEVIDATHHLINQIGKRKKRLEAHQNSTSSQKSSDDLPASLSMVASLRGEGVTYLSWALAATLVQDYSVKVCVVDLNWWWPFLSPLTAAKNPGVVGIITHKISMEECIVHTSLQNLSFLPAGKSEKQERSGFARSPELKHLVNELSRSFDHVILDIPSIRATPNTVPLAHLADGCCLVIRQGVTPMNDVQNTLDEISHLSILGVILNQVRYQTPVWLQKILPPVT